MLVKINLIQVAPEKKAGKKEETRGWDGGMKGYGTYGVDVRKYGVAENGRGGVGQFKVPR